MAETNQVCTSITITNPDTGGDDGGNNGGDDGGDPIDPGIDPVVGLLALGGAYAYSRKRS